MPWARPQNAAIKQQASGATVASTPPRLPRPGPLSRQPLTGPRGPLWTRLTVKRPSPREAAVTLSCAADSLPGPPAHGSSPGGNTVLCVTRLQCPGTTPSSGLLSAVQPWAPSVAGPGSLAEATHAPALKPPAYLPPTRPGSSSRHDCGTGCLGRKPSARQQRPGWATSHRARPLRGAEVEALLAEHGTWILPRRPAQCKHEGGVCCSQAP